MHGIMNIFTKEKTDKVQTITSLEVAEKMKSIYVLENELGNVKIGVSCNVEGRVNNLSRQGGFNIKNLFYTMPCSNAYKIERMLHKKFLRKRINGEWFEEDFSKAVCEANKLFLEYAILKPKLKKLVTLEGIEKRYESDKKECLFEKLDEVNKAAEIIIRAYKDNGVNPEQIAQTVGNIYKNFGLNIFLPPIKNNY